MDYTGQFIKTLSVVVLVIQNNSDNSLSQKCLFFKLLTAL
jgi:hypothetical protein